MGGGEAGHVNLSVNLKRLRMEAGMSQKELSEQIGCTQSALSHWEKGVRVPTLDFVIKIADTFEVQLDQLVGRDSPPVKEPKPWKLSYSGADQILTSVESVIYTMMVDQELAKLPNREIVK